MKVKIIITNDLGKTYEGEVNLNQTNNSTTIKSKKSKIKKKMRGAKNSVRESCKRKLFPRTKIHERFVRRIEN